MKFLKVKSVTLHESETVYHMTVKNNRNFFANSLCVHNCDYIGELMIILDNISNNSEAIIDHNDRIAQLLFAPVTIAKFNIVTELNKTERGEGGFGSTGKS